ncbi:conserved hypothetical protein [Ricinus communis]|uniref:Uncharacterized protein n=1 Tax=Ricinus communis TaxID=3988 RepID=B9T0H0_RICCO|nr:conserved hypothetical protein [Ricinus communis]
MITMMGLIHPFLNSDASQKQVMDLPRRIRKRRSKFLLSSLAIKSLPLGKQLNFRERGGAKRLTCQSESTEKIKSGAEWSGFGTEEKFTYILTTLYERLYMQSRRSGNSNKQINAEINANRQSDKKNEKYYDKQKKCNQRLFEKATPKI